MRFYKDTNGVWLCNNRVAISGTLDATFYGTDVVIKKLGQDSVDAEYYRGPITNIEKETAPGAGTFIPVTDKADFLLTYKDFFVNPLNPLKEDVEGLQQDVSAIQGGYLGTLLHTDAAPEPGLSGIYKFISAGVVSWLSGTPTVAVGDEVSVVFTDPTYTYTYIQNTNEQLVNKQNSLAADGTGVKYPTVDAVNVGLALNEKLANKQNHLTADGTGTKYPTVDAVNAGSALKVAYTDSLKYYPIINYGNRVLADSGVISDLEKLTKLYVENLKLLDNTVFLWDGSAGIKTRTSGANTYATKLYDMSAGNRDATETTEANQSHVSGLVAPNEQRKLKGLTGETGVKRVAGTDIQIASSSAFTLAIAVKWNYPRTSSRIYLSETNYIELTASSITLKGDSGNVLTCAHTFRTGLTEILTFEYNNGVGLIRVNGVEKTTTVTSDAVTFGSLFLSQTSNFRNFDGEIGKLQIANIRLSASQIQSLYNFTRLQHPEIEGINIGNQHWATSNYEGVVTGNRTVIPEVQGASTATNPELMSPIDITQASWVIIVAGTTKNDANTFTTTSYGGVTRSYLTVGKSYVLTFDIATTATNVRVYNSDTSTVAPITSGVPFVAVNTNLYIRNGGAGVTDINSISLKEVGWAALTTPAWCYYNNDPLNGAVYGKNYNLLAAQAINLNAPTGYTIGTYAQWLQMVTLLGGTSVAGNKMKLNGTALWAVGNLGTNESGFTALPNGQRNADGTFSQLNNKANFWTSDGYLVTLDYNAATVTFTPGADAKIGAAVRLLRNEPVGDNERTITTGYITNALGATNLDIIIPFGYQVESIRFDSETNITGLSAKLYTGALTELETLFTAKSVTANVQKVIAADADQSIQQTDAVVRINGTKANTASRFRVWIKLTKVVFS